TQCLLFPARSIQVRVASTYACPPCPSYQVVRTYASSWKQARITSNLRWSRARRSRRTRSNSSSRSRSTSSRRDWSGVMMPSSFDDVGACRASVQSERVGRASVRSGRAGLRCGSPATQDGLHLAVLLEPEQAELPAVARLLVAAERQAAVERRAVDVDPARADPVRHGTGPLGIVRLHEAGQTVGGVVRDLDRLVLGV